MAMVLHRYAQDLECMHPDGSIFDSLLAFQHHVYGPGEEADKGIPF